MKDEEIMDNKLTDTVEVRKNHFVRMDRRTFLKMAAMATGALALSNSKLIDPAMAAIMPQTPLPGTAILKYADSMPVFGPAGPIPRINGSLPITATMKPFTQQVLSTNTPLAPGIVVNPAGVGWTNVWAYQISDGTNTIINYPTVTIEATKGTPTQVTYVNNLTPNLYNYLTVDQTLHWADPQMNMPQITPYTGPVPAVVHLHGGEVPPQVDGGPDAWWTPNGLRGHAYFSELGAAVDAAKYTYPNVQESTTLFFHDHALGVTRLNVYAGLAGLYFIRDNMETAVTPSLPGGAFEIEIALQDRMFDNTGQWLFPDIGVNPTVHPFWVPEFFGDAIVVNGKTWPYLVVEPRRYRLRFVNGSNARFYNLNLPGVQFWQIGTDGGLLDTPVKVNRLLIAPGERMDVIVDFASVAKKTGVNKVIMTNNANAPFPVGIAPALQTVGQIMQFRVNPLTAATPPDTSFNPAVKGVTLRGGLNQGPAIVRLVNPATGTLAAGVTPSVKRSLTLNEWLDTNTLMPLEMLLNNTKYNGKRPNGTVPTGFTQPDPRVDTWYSEIVQEGTTEVWEIINLTVDAHPMHLHLVQFQLLNRQAFDTIGYQAAYGALFPGGAWVPEYGPPNPYNTTNISGYVGGNPDVTPFLGVNPIIPPNQNERGWKDTVVTPPGQVTRIAVRFAPLDKPLNDPNLYYPFNPNGGHGYVWHCHIIDHEDNEMMRPYNVTPASVAVPTLIPITTTPDLVIPGKYTFATTPTFAGILTGKVEWTVKDGTGTIIATGAGTSFVYTFTPAVPPAATVTYTIEAKATDIRGQSSLIQTTTVTV